MTLYEQHIGRISTKSDMDAEREFYVSRILTKEQMDNRRKLIKKEIPKQLQLWA